jgi:hypothetical protein
MDLVPIIEHAERQQQRLDDKCAQLITAKARIAELESVNAALRDELAGQHAAEIASCLGEQPVPDHTREIFVNFTLDTGPLEALIDAQFAQALQAAFATKN